MEDYLVRGISHNGHIQAFGALSTNLVNDAVKHHDLWPVATAALGRTMTVTAMMANRMKEEKGKIEVSIDGQGPLGKILVQAKPNGGIKGYVTNPHVNYELYPGGGLNVGKAVGTDGSLKVTKDLGLKQPFVGDVALQTGEIGDDFAYYFTLSEQIPSAVGVGVLVGTDNKAMVAGGWIIQVMPEATDQEITELEEAVNKVESVSTLLQKGYKPEEIIKMLIPDFEELERTPLNFKCDCSKEKCENILNLLKLKDLKEIIDNDEKCDMHCEFCSTTYHFTKEELEEIFNKRLEQCQIRLESEK